jgi:hypothetical protein
MLFDDCMMLVVRTFVYVSIYRQILFSHIVFKMVSIGVFTMYDPFHCDCACVVLNKESNDVPKAPAAAVYNVSSLVPGKFHLFMESFYDQLFIDKSNTPSRFVLNKRTFDTIHDFCIVSFQRFF